MEKVTLHPAQKKIFKANEAGKKVKLVTFPPRLKKRLEHCASCIDEKEMGYGKDVPACCCRHWQV